MHTATAGMEQMGQSLHSPMNTVLETLQEGTAFFPGSSLAGNGLLVSDGAVWQRQRQLTNPGFRKAAVETYAAVSHLSADRQQVCTVCRWFCCVEHPVRAVHTYMERQGRDRHALLLLLCWSELDCMHAMHAAGQSMLQIRVSCSLKGCRVDCQMWPT